MCTDRMYSVGEYPLGTLIMRRLQQRSQLGQMAAWAVSMWLKKGDTARFTDAQWRRLIVLTNPNRRSDNKDHFRRLPRPRSVPLPPLEKIKL